MAAPIPEKESSAALLKRLSIATINAINTRDFDFTSPEAQEVVKHTSPYWTGQLDTQPATVTWEEQKSLFKERAKRQPDIVFSIRDISVDVNEQKRVATVVMEMAVSGVGDLRLIALNESRWRLIDSDDGQKWMCFFTLGMRGSHINSGLP